MSTVSQLPPATAETTRVTREGRKLTYRLSVIQQPERARACGSGAKACSDRRPVDPPPVVELHIIDGDGHDITFSYNANFFLYTELQLDRPIINGRVQNAPAQTPPVLTGCPVSGMAYLDRPDFAGYFIFPDLSVRHEGKYRLTFSLYEQTKEAKDEDVETQDPKYKEACPDGSFDWRLKVQSNPFTVFSAKKFPGLSESTPLSRTVAEQGCRVRIRRDVRMRRRDGKAGGEFDEDRRSESPEGFSNRQRSITPHTPLGTPPTAQQAAGYLQFPSANTQQFSAPAPPPPRAPQAPAQAPPPQYYVAPPPQAPAYQPAYHAQQPPPQPQYGYFDRPAQAQGPPPYGPPSYAHPPQPLPPSREQAAEDEYHRANAYHRASVSYTPGPPQTPTTPYPADQSAHSRSQSLSYPPPAHAHNGAPQPHPPHHPQHPASLAPLKMAPLEPKFDASAHQSPTGPLSARGSVSAAPPLASPSHYDRGNPYASYPTPVSMSAPPMPVQAPKRAYDAAFANGAQGYHHQPLHNGMRPTEGYQPAPPPQQQHQPHHHHQSQPPQRHAMPSKANMYDDDDDEDVYEAFRMSYKRADGSAHSRELPMLE